MATKVKERSFIDGIGSYAAEYDWWKKNPPVKRLFGVFELAPDEFYQPAAERVKAIGRDYTVIFWKSALNNSAEAADRSTVAAGCAMGVKDRYGRVGAIVCVRATINPPQDVPPVESTPEVTHEVENGVRLLVLMHELGHADDIAKGLNFNQEAGTIDLVAAELYAHSFVCRHAKRIGYRIALAFYIKQIESGLTSEDESVRLSSEQMLKSPDMDDYRKASSIRDPKFLQLQREALLKTKKLPR